MKMKDSRMVISIKYSSGTISVIYADFDNLTVTLAVTPGRSSSRCGRIRQSGSQSMIIPVHQAPVQPRFPPASREFTSCTGAVPSHPNICIPGHGKSGPDSSPPGVNR